MFAPARWPRLAAAVSDYSWLLTRGYSQPSGIKLVGDRFNLNQRQRAAVLRCACADEAVQTRRAKEIPLAVLAGHALWIDGFNVLTTIEVALAGGVVLRARDGCYRDIASVHGTYRKVEETRPAIAAVARTLAKSRPATCLWLLDRPVGNSGRLKELLLQGAAAHGLDWTAELVLDPDSRLIESDAIVASADSAILDRCRAWVNLARAVIDQHVAQARIVPMDGG